MLTLSSDKCQRTNYFRFRFLSNIKEPLDGLTMTSMCCAYWVSVCIERKERKLSRSLLLHENYCSQSWIEDCMKRDVEEIAGQSFPFTQSSTNFSRCLLLRGTFTLDVPNQRWHDCDHVFSRSCFLRSRATYLLTIVSVCLVDCLIDWLLDCGQLCPWLTPGGSFLTFY